MKDDVISRHGVSAWLDNMGHPEFADVVMDEDRFPSAQPEITEEQVREYCRKRCLSVVGNELLAKYINGCQDTISRQAAVDAFDGVKVDEENCTEYDIGYNDGIDFAVSRLSVLPSAQPDVPDTNVGDLISREAMGDALNRMRVSKNETWYSFYQKVLDVLCRLPSSQPERKRGKWVKARGSWCTPGGDPVWECSECGKGVHVYGVEHGSYGSDVADGQWVSCPNCGAEMSKE